MRFPLNSCRKSVRSGKILQLSICLLMIVMVTKIYSVFKEETEEGAVIQTAMNKSITTAVKKKVVPVIKLMTKKKPVVKPKPKPKPKKDLGKKYTLGAFKEFINVSIPAPMDHHDLMFLLHPQGVCDKKLDFLIIVHSSVNNKERRDVLRFTIGRFADNAEMKYKMFFVTGTPKASSGSLAVNVLREQSEYNDILVVDTVDSYRNMTYKAVGWIKWVTEYCENRPRYIIKMDDDALVKIPSLIKMLRPCDKSNKDKICTQLSCLLRPKEPALRYGKNKITYTEYPLKHYPPMCPGLLYIMPATLLEPLLEATESVPFIWLDDVYVTVFLRVKINENINSLRRFYMQPHDKNYKQLNNNKVIAHLQSKTFVTDYVKIWNQMMDKK